MKRLFFIFDCEVHLNFKPFENFELSAQQFNKQKNVIKSPL